MLRTLLVACLILALGAASRPPGRKVIVPANAAKPVGPYSPGILVGDYLYVSGQGVRDAGGAMPDGIAAQTRQCLENVKAIVEAAGLTLEHVVDMQLYLERMSDFAEVDRVYAGYFPAAPPARVVVGVAKMPTETTVEMTAVAVRDSKLKKPLALKSLAPPGHASPAVAVGDRIYLSAAYGKNPAEAERSLKLALDEARLGTGGILLRNEYGTSASAMIPTRELPGEAQAAISAIAVRGQEGSAGVCAADGKTIFCAAQAGADPGETGVGGQVRAVMKKLQAGLARHGAALSQVTASNVYLDDIQEFGPMNEAYGSFFPRDRPTRTTVQPFPPAGRAPGVAPLVRISVVAVKD
jgi:2-iminobutanoate/2-iminopropanoate deaminase